MFFVFCIFWLCLAESVGREMKREVKCPNCGEVLDFMDYDPDEKPFAYFCEKCFFGCKISDLKLFTSAIESFREKYGRAT